MDNSSDYTKLIVRYLNNELDEVEKQKYEQKLKNNQKLKKQHRLLLQMYEVYSDIDSIEFREKLINIESKIIDRNDGLHNKAKTFFKKQYLLKAAIIVSFISIGIILYFLIKNTNPNNNKIFAMYYNTLPTDGFIRSGNSTVINCYSEILDAYSHNNYNKVIKIYENNKTKLEEKPELLLYIGIAFIETENYESAINLFNIIETNCLDTKIVLCYAIWYKGLCYLKTGKILKSINEFQILRQNYNFKQKKVDKIIREIKRIKM